MTAPLVAVLAISASAAAAQRRLDPIAGERRTAIGLAAARVAPAVVSVNVLRRERTLPRSLGLVVTNQPPPNRSPR